MRDTTVVGVGHPLPQDALDRHRSDPGADGVLAGLALWLAEVSKEAALTTIGDRANPATDPAGFE